MLVVMTMTKLSTTNESEESLDLQRRGVQKIKTRTKTQRDWHWLNSGSPEVKEGSLSYVFGPIAPSCVVSDAFKLCY
jgi:hypothetical protein